MPMSYTCRGCQGIAEGWHQRRPFCFPVKSTWDAESTYLQFVTYSSYKLCIDSLKSSLLRDLLQHFCLQSQLSLELIAELESPHECTFPEAWVFKCDWAWPSVTAPLPLLSRQYLLTTELRERRTCSLERPQQPPNSNRSESDS